MSSPDLERLFNSLVLPLDRPNGRSLSAVMIPEVLDHRLGKDADGAPCLLLRQHIETLPSPPIRLQNLTVSYGVPCVVARLDGLEENGIFTIVKCSGADPSLFSHFLRIVSPIVETLGAAPSPAAIRRAISGLVELFQALASPSQKSVQGLWAELLVIRYASDPSRVATAWHNSPSERVDFMEGAHRVEVKSSSTRRRVHHFSQLQLTPPAATRVIVASVFVESGSGLSLRRLADEIRAVLAPNPELLAQFDRVFYSTLGAGWSEAMEESFDLELAQESLLFYASEAIPKIEGTISPALSGVHFESDLSSSVPLTSSALRSAGGLFAAANPA